MTIVGQAGTVTVPSGYLAKKGADSGIPITSFYGSFDVGSIPVCRVGIPVEFIEDIPNKSTQELYEVKIGTAGSLHTVFTGYISGRSGRLGEKSIEAGVSLVHPARDMDTMRLLAPGMHSQGAPDWSYETAPGGDGFSDTATDNLYFDAGGGGTLPSQIISGILKALEARKTSEARDALDGTIAFPEVSYDKTTALLKSLKILNGTLPGIGTLLEESINEFVRSELEGSIDTQASLWNSICGIFGQFGLLMICDHKGDVLVSADVSNFTPPDSNYFYSDKIYSFDQSSSFGRNVSEVNLINQTNRPDPNKAQGVITLATFKDPNDDGSGGAIAMGLPGWLSPINSFVVDTDPKEPPSPCNPSAVSVPSEGDGEQDLIRGIYKDLARAQYYIERNKWRTMTFCSPLLPNITPGTTVYVQPYGSVKALSGKEIGSGALYSGYLAGVQHSVDAGSRSMHTTLTLRNVSDVTEDLNITKHPIFTDVKAFVLG